MTDIWNAAEYSQFLNLRTRPAVDLLAVIPRSFQPKTIYDLGCGPGNSTILLKNRWPEAHVVGLDSSLDMLKQAGITYPEISFIEGNIAQFSPEKKADCIFANASLQWISQHERLIPMLLTSLNPGGVLAMQMPNNFHSPSHQTIVLILQNHDVWQSYLKNLFYGVLSKPLYDLTWYYDLLIKSGMHSLQCWETEYFQELSGYQAIYDWVKGTGLRPVLSVMSHEDQRLFADEYINKITNSYQLQANNRVLLPFRRIFMVGYK